MSWVVSKLLEWNVTGRYRITHARASQRVYTQFIPLRLKNYLCFITLLNARGLVTGTAVLADEKCLSKKTEVYLILSMFSEICFRSDRRISTDTVRSDLIRCCPFTQGHSILGDPGAVSRVGTKGGTKVFKYGRKSSWVPTLTELFPKIRADAGSWLGTKMLCIIVPNRRTVSPEFFFREFVHHGYCLATLARFVHQTCASKGNFYLLLS